MMQYGRPELLLGPRISVDSGKVVLFFAGGAVDLGRSAGLHEGGS